MRPNKETKPEWQFAVLLTVMNQADMVAVAVAKHHQKQVKRGGYGLKNKDASKQRPATCSNNRKYQGPAIIKF
jgi:hypothetical protein